MRKVYIGTSGWSYPTGADKWRGIFYPPHVDELSYYAERLPAVEVNSTFYHIPDITVAHDWVRRTPAGFRFAVKLFMKFTHPGMYKSTTGNEEKITPQDIGQMRGILGALAARVKIDSPIYNNLDAPDVAGNAVYYRLHGRNATAWHQRGAGNERYDYLYSTDEINDIADKLREGSTARDVVVFFNNHPGGKALVNAVQLSANLGLPLPYAKFTQLARSFPQLADITRPADEQLDIVL